MNKSPFVYFIGAGPGDPGLITVRGQDIVRRADLVLYAGSLVPREVVACAKQDARVVDSAQLDLDQTHALIMATVREGGLVARVHTGDPSLYGTIREQTKLLRDEGVDFAIIPGVTAAFAAAARAGVSFTVPEATQSLIITRLSGRTPVPERETLARLAGHGSSVAVYLSADKAADLARELRQAGTGENTVIIIAVKVGHPEEEIITSTLATVEADVRRHKVTRQAVFLILPGETAPDRLSRLYAPDFGHGFRSPRRPATWNRLAVYAMTSQGLELARRIRDMAGADLFAPARLAAEDVTGFTSITTQVRANFDQYHGHVFVAAAGIVVRAIAPLLDSKTTDPAVVVCDQAGRHVVSLLSGHLGGANSLARRIADHLGATAVITTATDTAGRPAMDTLAQQTGCVIANPAALTRINAVLAEGGVVTVHDPGDWLSLAGAGHDQLTPAASPAMAEVTVTWHRQGQGLILHPPALTAGIGCRRGVAVNEIVQALTQVLDQHDLAPASLARLASVDLKNDEPGLIEAARILGLELEFFTRDVLGATPVPNPSARVQEKIGVDSVCEAAALNAARKISPLAGLIVPKTIVGAVTVALAG
jgi:precorrin-4/cobalt-precorrin-4 C11-methyltransferase